MMGLGFVLSFGYWCTDFLVIQRAMAADSMTRRAADAADRRGAQDVLPVPGHPARPDRHRAAHSQAAEPPTGQPEVRGDAQALGQGIIPAKVDPDTGKVDGRQQR